jgi:hypothetical protein
MRWRTNAMLAVVVSTLAVGCDSPTPKAGTSATAPPKAKVEARKTIGKYTQNVLRLEDALNDGAILAATNVEESDPLTQAAGVYRTSVAKIGGFAVTHTMQAHEALNGPIKNYDEFMEFIIKKGQPDGLQLPMLPYYQEYAYDEANRKLVTVEFPEKKKQFETQKP